MADKCPKCGSERDGIHASPHYLCGSGDEGHGIEQSEECELRCELAALKDRHAKLVEAAGKVVEEDRINRRQRSGCGHSCPLNDQIQELDEALESEAKG